MSTCLVCELKTPLNFQVTEINHHLVRFTWEITFLNFQVDLAPSLGALLTSGYLPFHSLPEGASEATKCAFGGTRDEGENGGEGVGAGINKATGNSCYSPHADEHQDAANLAVQVRVVVVVVVVVAFLVLPSAAAAAAAAAAVIIVAFLQLLMLLFLFFPLLLLLLFCSRFPYALQLFVAAVASSNSAGMRLAKRQNQLFFPGFRDCDFI